MNVKELTESIQKQCETRRTDTGERRSTNVGLPLLLHKRIRCIAVNADVAVEDVLACAAEYIVNIMEANK